MESRNPTDRYTAPSATRPPTGQVPFELVPDLVAGRRVLLRAGSAYVSKDQVASLVVQPFRAGLAKGLALTARRWAAVVAPGEADRLTPVVESLSQRCVWVGGVGGSGEGEGGALGERCCGCWRRCRR